jgi:hypothetical protein
MIFKSKLSFQFCVLSKSRQPVHKSYLAKTKLNTYTSNYSIQDLLDPLDNRIRKAKIANLPEKSKSLTIFIGK